MAIWQMKRAKSTAPSYEREIERKNRLGALLKPTMGKFYDTNAP
jgi:hypothetical protein